MRHAPPRPPRYVQVAACPNFPTENPWEDGYQFPVVLLSNGGTSTINAPNVQCAIAAIFAAPQETPSLENPIRWLVGSDNTEYTGDASQAIVEVVLSGSASGYTCVVQFIDA